MKKIIKSMLLLGALTITSCGSNVHLISKETWTTKVNSMEKQNYETASFKIDVAVVTTTKTGNEEAKSQTTTESFEAKYTYNVDTQTWSSSKEGSEEYVSVIGTRAIDLAPSLTTLEENNFVVTYFDDLSVVAAGKGVAALGQIVDADESFLFKFNKYSYLTSQLVTEVSVTKEKGTTITVVETESISINYSL